MAGIEVLAPYEFFTDLNGTALEAGKIYVGEVGLDPRSNPVSIFTDDALTVPIAQPVRTIAGIPDGNGTPVELFVDGEYSIAVDDKNNVQIFAILDPSFSASASLPLSGGTMSGEINMGGNKITNLANGTDPQDVVSLLQMDTGDALRLLLTGGTLTGDLTIDKTTPKLILSATSTDEASVEIGPGRAGDGNSFVDLVGDITFSDFGLRVIRNAGENADSELIHRGTGSLRLSTTDLGDVEFSTNNTLRVTIDATTGDVTITGSDLIVNGDIDVTGLVDGRDVAADGVVLDGLAGGNGGVPGLTDIGSSIFAIITLGSSPSAAGTTLPGAELSYADAFGNINPIPTSPDVGIWRQQGYIEGGVPASPTVWVRIS